VSERSRPLRLGLYLSQIEHIEGADPSMLVEMAQTAEAAGFDDIFMGEHIAAGPDSARDRHLRTTNKRGFGGDWGHPPQKPWLEVVTALAAVAGGTRRVRLCATAMIAPLRNHLVSAKALASLDVLSRGRLVVMPAPSWQPREYAAAGIDFRTRGKRLDDMLGAWHALWGPSPASYHSETISFEDMYCEPKPFRAPGPTLWFGGQSMHPALVRRLVRYGSGLVPLFVPSPDDWKRLDEALATAGRDRSELELVSAAIPIFHDDESPADIDDCWSQIESFIGLGITTFFVGAQAFVGSIDDLPRFCHRVSERFGDLR
jgi:alkanesulfonate monooxygenase SsuD/methylene tetrahydromethanopterin reductase-like flavin-dependent oxidoreductase (luciferase family)